MSAEVIIFAIPVVVLLLAGTLAHWSVKARNFAAIGLLALIVAVFTGAMLFEMDRATGLDGLGYLVALLGISAPAGVGLGVGSLTGWAGGKDIHA